MEKEWGADYSPGNYIFGMTGKTGGTTSNGMTTPG